MVSIVREIDLLRGLLLQASTPNRSLQLAQRFDFNLTNPLSRQVEDCADLLKRVRRGLANAIPHADHLFFPSR